MQGVGAKVALTILSTVSPDELTAGIAAQDKTVVARAKGVGPKMSGVLSKVGIHTVMDLLKHYPRRHLDFQNRLKKICLIII